MMDYYTYSEDFVLEAKIAVDDISMFNPMTHTRYTDISPPSGLLEYQRAIFSVEDKVWTVVDNVELLQAQFEQAKSEKINNLSFSVETKILSGFVSDALGSAHHYPSKRDDQMNLIGLASSGVPQTFPCVQENLDKTVYSNWINPEHSAEQLKQLQNEGIIKKTQLRVDFRSRVESVNRAATINEIEQISEIF